MSKLLGALSLIAFGFMLGTVIFVNLAFEAGNKAVASGSVECELQEKPSKETEWVCARVEDRK